ncbi:MAG: STAS domain-containing protein [Proteobacteria bacterium]|nr:STAS domain-containing protein [Pseudomonadota bacterium]
MSSAKKVRRPARRAKAAPSRSRPAAAPSAAPAGPALPADLQIRGATALAATLRAAVAAGAEDVDASQVALVDTAGLQLLIAAGRLASAHGRALRWQRPSTALVDAANRLGVARQLGLGEAG